MVSIPNSTNNYIFTSNNSTPLLHHNHHHYAQPSSKLKPVEFYGGVSGGGNNSATTTTSSSFLHKNESEFNEFNQQQSQQTYIFNTTEFFNKCYDQNGTGSHQYNSSSNTLTTNSHVAYPTAFYPTNYVKQPSGTEYGTYLNTSTTGGFSVYDRSVSSLQQPYAYFTTQASNTNNDNTSSALNAQYVDYLNESKEIESGKLDNKSIDVNGFLSDVATSLNTDQSMIPKSKKQANKLPSSNQKKTRTKDKYRVVYNELQRTELEKEFNFSQYITSRRKAELASHLSLSTRQIKIWFQNRRAKDRKLSKRKKSEPKSSNSSATVNNPHHQVTIISNQVDMWPNQHLNVYSGNNYANN